jgi:hypothetical protein
MTGIFHCASRDRISGAVVKFTAPHDPVAARAAPPDLRQEGLPMRSIIDLLRSIVDLRSVVHPNIIALAIAPLVITFCATAPAEASTISYAWNGTVTFVDPISPATVSPGQKIGITLTLDNAVPDQDPSPTRGIYDQQMQPPNLVVAINIGGVTGVGSFQFGTVLANDAGVDEFKVSSGDQLIGGRFLIDFQTSHPGVLASDALPLSIDPKDFETAAFFVNPNNLLPMSFPIFSGTIDSQVAPTPLPGSVELFLPALVGLLGLGGWQKCRSGHA